MSRRLYFDWLSSRRDLRRRPTPRQQGGDSSFRRLRFEPLEDRRLLATFTVSNLNDSGAGSLRQAIIDANGEDGADTIAFSSVSGTIALTSGEMEINDTVSIEGPGAEVLTIDAQLQSRIFYLSWAGDTRISGLTLTRGMTFGIGGAIRSHAPYSSDFALTVDQCVISGNTALAGGAISVLGNLTVTHSTISGNGDSGSDSSAIDSYEGDVVITDSIVSGNYGFGIHNRRGSVTLNASTVSDNTNTGIHIDLRSQGVTLNSSTVSGNGGGGVYSAALIGSFDTNVTLNSSTVSGNTWSGFFSGSSGGIRTEYGDVILNSSTVSDNGSVHGAGGIHAYGDVTLVNSTVSNNSGSYGGGISADSVSLQSSTVTGNYAGSFGGGISSGSQIGITNSIVAGNTAGENGPDLSGYYFDIAFSLIGDNSGTSLTEAQTPDANGNLIGSFAGAGIIDPQLGPLANNGGPTQTHALLAGSPAIDRGDPTAIAGQGNTPIFDQRGAHFTRVYGGRIDMGAVESQPIPTIDFGDAPDTAPGSGPGNYQTRSIDDGPWHTIVPGLRIGAVVDADSGLLQNAEASADDVDEALPDDEDGLTNPVTDLIFTISTQPSVNVWVTNTTGTAASLLGWIDYNANGVFDYATERATVVVPSGTIGGPVTLVFPTVPSGFTGTTYARFRLSTDPAAANPTGAAADGEVEDYRVSVMKPNSGVPDHSKTVKIASSTSGGPTLSDFDQFGGSLASVGDIDGDGVTDLAAGAILDDTGGMNRGAVYVLFMNTDGTVKSSQKIASGTGGGPTLNNGDRFGRTLASLGDLDGDGVPDLAVGADLDDTGGSNRGAVYVLFMNSNGTVKSSQKIATGTGGGPTLVDSDRLGSSLTSLGDFDGDGLSDLAAGADGDNTAGIDRGAVHLLLLNADGTVKSSQKIASGLGGGPTLADSDRFGRSLTSLRDVDGDGVTDLAVGAVGDDTGGTDRGAVHMLLMNADGTVKDSQKIASGANGGPTLSNGDAFGSSAGSLGDLDGDGVTDLAVGAFYDNTGGSDRGAVHVLFLSSDGTVKRAQKIASNTGGGPTLGDNSSFGSSLAFLGDLDGDGIGDMAVGAEREDTGGTNRGAVHVFFLAQPHLDFGDAPDLGSGTGSGDYQTRYSDSGPQHLIVSGLQMGTNIDGEGGNLQNAAASADDINFALPDDEDGLVNPAADLLLTVGAQPTVNVWVTNTTGTAATLYGWIDYNANGVFDNGTEIASVAVPNSTSNGIVTLSFPAVPNSFTGTTYARFRLSTDAAAATATGAASDGEVEDYRATVTRPGSGTADNVKTKKIASGTNNGPTLANGDYLGRALASLGDLNGDGVTDLAVGAMGDDTGGQGRGAVHVLFLNADGTPKATQKIASGVGGGPTLANYDYFGRSLVSLGDLDGDGVSDLAVGVYEHARDSRGAVHVLFMRADGTVKSSQKIASGLGGGPTLASSDYFGSSLALLGDVDGDGVSDIAVGVTGDDTGGGDRGAVYVLFLNVDGTVKSSQKIASGTGGGPSLADADYFGRSLVSLGDLDGDGVSDLAVGAYADDTGGTGRGAVYVLFLNADGTIKSSQKIASGMGGGPILANSDYFGRSVALLGDLDGDGVNDLAVGAHEHGVDSRGAVYVLFLNANGTVKSSQKIASGMGGGPSLADFDYFGSSVALLGDLDGDGVIDLAVGARGDDTGGGDRGAVHVLFLKAANTDPIFTTPDTTSIPENTTAVMTVTAVDADLPAQQVIYSIVGGADQAKFGITSGGVLSFNSAPDFETPTDANGDNIYQVLVQASDGERGMATQLISASVTPVNDNNPVFTSSDTAAVPENTTFVQNVTATDFDLPAQTVTFSIAGGADQAKFNITSGGELSFVAPPDFEAPTDANSDNVYVVIVQASDGSFTNLQAVLISVTNVIEPPPLPGDYNKDNDVDAADYVFWRKTLGTTGLPAYSGADGDGNSTIDEGDYGVWTAHFGQSLPGSSESDFAEILAEPIISLAVTILTVPTTAAQTSFDENQPDAIAAVTRLSASEFSHRVFSWRHAKIRATRAVFQTADSHWERGLLSWLSELDRVFPVRSDRMTVPVVTDATEETFADAGSMQTVDEVFSSVSASWPKRLAHY
jgi:hypothetical protein